MGNHQKGHDRVIVMLLLTVLGTVASVVGVILTIVFRVKDKNNHKMKESNRHAKG